MRYYGTVGSIGVLQDVVLVAQEDAGHGFGQGEGGRGAVGKIDVEGGVLLADGLDGLAGQAVELPGAERFDAEIVVSKDGTKVGGTSIMGLMMLAAGIGSKLITSEALKAKDYAGIETKVRETIAIIKKIRGK